MKNKKNLLLGSALLVIILLLFGLFQLFGPKTQSGKKEITVSVCHGDNSVKEFTYTTDEEFLGKVLQDNKLVEGEVGQYGLFITSVDGEVADDSKKQWWCITKGQEMVSTSADLTPIADGDTFELTLSTY